MRPPYVTAEVLENGDLKIVPSEWCRGDLAELLAENPDRFDTDDVMHSVLDTLVDEGDYEWTRPELCGALTAAPMLAVYGEEKPLPVGADPVYFHIVAYAPHVAVYTPVEKCWAFMDYQVTSPQRQMLERGHCIFTAGR